MNSSKKNMAYRILAVEARLDRLEQNTVTQDDIARLYASVMDSADKGKTYFDKALSHGAMLQEHEARLKSHERRISTIENLGGEA
jgi:hypothetical protein